eukprot:scaffold31727_cov19-Cyclotella_meneghiniana.AAC.1
MAKEEAEARQKAEEEKKEAEAADAKQKAEEEKKTEAERKAKEEAEARQKAEEEKKEAEAADAKQKAEEEKKLAEAAEARQKGEEATSQQEEEKAIKAVLTGSHSAVGLGDILYFQGVQAINDPNRSIHNNVAAKIKSQNFATVYHLKSVNVMYLQAIKVKSEDNDEIKINKLAVRIDVGVHSVLDWILKQFSIDRSDLKSDDDSNLTDIISKYCDLHRDNRLLQYLLHTLKDELIRKYMAIEEERQKQTTPQACICFPIGYCMTSSSEVISGLISTRDITIMQAFSVLYCTAIVHTESARANATKLCVVNIGLTTVRLVDAVLPKSEDCNPQYLMRLNWLNVTLQNLR